MLHFFYMKQYSFLNKTISAPLVLFIFALFFGMGTPVLAQNQRTQTIDIYLLVDNSPAMSNSLQEAIAWLDKEIITGTVILGDRVSIWTLAGGPRLVARETLQDTATISQLREKLRGIQLAGGSGQLGLALEEVQRAEQARTDQEPIACVIVAATLSGADARAAAAYLRHSRTLDQSGWKAIVVGMDQVSTRASSATRAYMEASQNAPSR